MDAEGLPRLVGTTYNHFARVRGHDSDSESSKARNKKYISTFYLAPTRSLKTITSF